MLDGFDIGAGIILFVAKDDAERRAVLASIGPVWDGNEVWLLATGGTLYFAFPGLYVSSLMPLVLLVSVASFRIQPLLLASFEAHPWGLVFPAVAAAGLGGVMFSLKHHRKSPAFLFSCVFILGLLCSAAMGLYPNRAAIQHDPGCSLTVASVSASGYGLQIGLWWFVRAFALALAYSVFVYRHFDGKVGANFHNH